MAFISVISSNLVDKGFGCYISFNVPKSHFKKTLEWNGENAFVWKMFSAKVHTGTLKRYLEVFCKISEGSS